MHKLCQITHNLESVELFGFRRHLPILNRLDEHRYDVSQVRLVTPGGSKLAAAYGQSLLDLSGLSVVRHEPLAPAPELADPLTTLLVLDGELMPDVLLRTTGVMRALEVMPQLLLTALPKD